mgnify:CR=1 FL=1
MRNNSSRDKYNFRHLKPWFKGSDVSHFIASTETEYQVLYFDNGTKPDDDELKHSLDNQQKD